MCTAAVDESLYQFDLISLAADKQTVNMRICGEWKHMNKSNQIEKFKISQPTHYSHLEIDAFWRLDLIQGADIPES